MIRNLNLLEAAFESTIGSIIVNQNTNECFVIILRSLERSPQEFNLFKDFEIKNIKTQKIYNVESLLLRFPQREFTLYKVKSDI